MEKLKAINERLQNVLDRQVELGQAAGVNLLVLQRGSEIAYVQSGYADIDKKTPFDRDTIMRIYSMSKPVTAAAVMLLVQRGAISLGEPVSRYLPGFKEQLIIKEDGDIPLVRPAYIRDLLSMTSGLPYGEPGGKGAFLKAQQVFDRVDEMLYTDSPLTTVEIANELGRAGVAFQPGERWLYGTSADVLGAVVEVVSGKKFGEFLQDEFFTPLEMKDTGFYVPEAKRSRMASVYERCDGVLKLFETNHLGLRYMRDVVPAFESGGAGLTSTLDDYAHFAAMLINGGEYKGKRIMDEAIVRYMSSGRLTPWQEHGMWHDWDGRAGYSYGCLMQHMIDPQMAYSLGWMDEYGWDGWLGTYFCNSPHNGISILMGMQINNPDGNLIFEKVKNTLVQCIP